MKRATVFFAISLLLYFQGYGQVETTASGPQPVEGVHQLALIYYKINFTKEQRDFLQNKEVELIYSIDTSGHPTLEKVHGVSEVPILDSLQKTTDRLARFYPYTVDGIPEKALYFLKIRFPAYGGLSNSVIYHHTFPPKRLRIEDFEYIHKSGKRLDILIGGAVNSFSGSMGKYLDTGGGMKLDLMFIGREASGAGLTMGMYGNRLLQEYPINSTREQNSAPPTLLLGLSFNKAIRKKDRNELNLQLELCYAIQNITPRLDTNVKEWTQLKGFSPGLVCNYFFQLGNSKVDFSYGGPSMVSHYLNLHGAIRPMFLNLKEATGVMAELGISYRLGNYFVEDFRLKPEFRN